MTSAGLNAVDDSILRGETAVAVVDDPVEDDLVQGFNDSHVVDGGVQIVMGQALEFPA